MVEFSVVHRPALGRVKSGSFGATGTSGRIRLDALAEGHVLQVLAGIGTDPLSPERLAALSDGGAHAVRAAGPGHWFIVGDAALSPSAIGEKTATLSGVASIADQGHGRVRIGIGGDSVETVLAKGTAVDLHPDRFPVGRSAMTLIGHITALITRVEADRFEIVVLRGFAESLWDELIGMSLEFGVDATANG